MGKNGIIISSDESDEATTPVNRKRPARNAKPLTNEPELTSESDGEKIVFKRVKNELKKSQEEIMLGEISLLTSDEEYVPEPRPPKKKATKKPAPVPKQQDMNAIAILTSDEEGSASKVSKPPVARKKRKPPETSSNDIIPPKRIKITPKPKSSAQSKKPSTRVSPNASFDTSMEEICPIWKDSELLAERSHIDEEIARNLIKLWDDGNTIPFIARYRKNAIKDMTPEELRTTKEGYDQICVLKRKMCTVAKTVTQLGKLDNKLQRNICSARTIEELEHIYAPFKVDSKGSLAERAKKCGLEEPALHLLNNTSMINPVDYVKSDVKDIKTPEDVERGIMHILASEMATDQELLVFLRELRSLTTFWLHTKKARQTKAKEKPPENNKKNPKLEEVKFEMYFDFNQPVKNLKSHQILAINRGESLKILSVKIDIPQIVVNKFKFFCNEKWTNKSKYDTKRQDIMKLAIEDAFQRLITPLITREIRADLKLMAEKESCKIFSDNLKHLLLASPMKGKAILGVDPGYTNGCKLALISPTGSLLAQNVVFPHSNKNAFKGESVVKDMLLKYRCNQIAIGNGTACRQTEQWISDLIKRHYFGSIDVQYTIVSEDGASIYSCSPEARKEFGTLDPNIISAVSLARRIQDPMAELVKVEPCHLGVGMYQLDIKKKQLEEALNEVVSECVSFVGVDLNTASQCLLRRVAGLSDKRATQIIDYRQRNGPFTHRRELLNVFGIGERIFEQCAGFLRICPTDLNDIDFYKKPSTTPLDATVIHPESYPTVRSLLAIMDLKEKDIGSEYFIRTIVSKSKEYHIENLAQSFKTDKQTIQLIFDALSKTLNHDSRIEVNKTPLFKKSITSMKDLKEGTIVTGRVKNVTSFGAFVDIGVERDGLIYVTCMKGLTLHLGDVMEVKVKNVDLAKGRIYLVNPRKI